MQIAKAMNWRCTTYGGSLDEMWKDHITPWLEAQRKKEAGKQMKQEDGCLPLVSMEAKAGGCCNVVVFKGED